MKLELVLLIVFLVSVYQSTSSSLNRNDKRYYDAWDAETDLGVGNNQNNVRVGSANGKNFKKIDLCENKPLWFLKHQAKLGKLSPFYDCLFEYGLE